MREPYRIRKDHDSVALLRHLNTDERKIWTAEDPIEITQEGLRQVQVHPKIGFAFAAAMRSFLRADPDIIMIGEMRDKDTANVATRLTSFYLPFGDWAHKWPSELGMLRNA